MTMTARRKVLLTTLAAVIVAGILEAMSATVIWATAAKLDHPIRRTPAIYAEQSRQIERQFLSNDTHGLILDPVLGWRYRHGWVDSTTRINALGLRSERDYAPVPAPGTLRIAAFGDSFVYGNEVSGPDTWASYIEQSDSTIEVLNYGVGGYGVDQAFLRYQLEAHAMNPHMVIIGFATDDLRRLVNVYRRFLSVDEIPLFKPRYTLEADSLRLIPNPVHSVEQYRNLVANPRSVRELGGADQWYEPLVYQNPLHDWSATARLMSALWIRVANRYVRNDRIFDGAEFNTQSAAFALQVALFEAFHDSVAAAGSRPVVLFLPDRQSVYAGAAGGRTLYAPLAERLTERGIPFFDGVEAFVAHKPGPTDAWFLPQGHYSAEANRILAEWLLKKLK
jgi:hypothetical protein